MRELSLRPDRISIPTVCEQTRAQRDDCDEGEHTVDVEGVDVVDAVENPVRHGEGNGHDAENDADDHQSRTEAFTQICMSTAMHRPKPMMRAFFGTNARPTNPA